MRTRALLRRMRWDMAVCFILTMLCIVGISELDNKIGFFKKGFDAMEEAVSSDQSTSIPNGEIGGFATEDTPRIEPEEEALRKTDETFTMEVKSVEKLQELNLAQEFGATLEQCSLELDRENNTCLVMFDKHQIQVPQILSRIMELTEVKDVQIQETELAEIVKAIYRHENGEENK